VKRLVTFTAIALAIAAPALAGDDAAAPLPRETGEAAVIRGSIAFRTYCVLCHGTEGKGNGRAAKMYTPRPSARSTTNTRK
jgi:mono/diheme cytochrome c family protein